MKSGRVRVADNFLVSIWVVQPGDVMDATCGSLAMTQPTWQRLSVPLVPTESTSSNRDIIDAQSFGR
jgi:hypothetical protein